MATAQLVKKPLIWALTLKLHNCITDREVQVHPVKLLELSYVYSLIMTETNYKRALLIKLQCKLNINALGQSQRSNFFSHS